MKSIIVISGAVMLLSAGCSTNTDYYGASDEFFATPSWGTDSATSSNPATGTDSMNPDSSRNLDTHDSDLRGPSQESREGGDANDVDSPSNDQSLEGQQPDSQ